jgi:hypothetical protein
MHNYNITYSDDVLYSLAFFIENLKLQRKRKYTNTGLEDLLYLEKNLIVVEDIKIDR